MIPVQEIEPPCVDGIDDDDEDTPHIYIMMSISEVDGTMRNASLAISPDADAVQIADALVSVVRSVAVLRDPYVAEALKERGVW